VALDLFAGIPVSDYVTALGWYEQLLGSAPSFLPTPTESVVGGHRTRFRVHRGAT